MVAQQFPQQLALTAEAELERLDGRPIVIAPTVIDVIDRTSVASDTIGSMWTIEASIGSSSACQGIIFFELDASSSQAWLKEHDPIFLVTKTIEIPAIGLILGGELLLAQRGEEFRTSLAAIAHALTPSPIVRGVALKRSLH